MATRSATNNGAPVKPDQMLSLGEWKKLTLDSLRRKCSDHKLEVKGKKLDLALRLFQKFHKDSVKNRRGATARNAKTPPNDPGLPPSPPEIIRADDEPVDMVINDGNTESVDTVAYGKDQTAKNDDPPPPAESEDIEEDEEEIEFNLNNIIQRNVDASVKSAVGSEVGKAVSDAMKPVLEEMALFRQRNQLAEAENRALRSQLENVKAAGNHNNSVFSPPPSPSIPISVPPVVSVATIVNSAISTQATSTSGCSGGIFSSPNMSTNYSSVATKNPFNLPGLLKKHLLIIEQGEYLDFDKIKPKGLDQRKREDGEEGFGVAMTTHFDSDLGEETLRLKRVSTNKIEVFPEWLESWNKWLCARLHYRPEEHAMLMAYQRKITSFAKKYKFSAVYNYDIDFRKTVAAERSLPPEHRTALWDKQHDELKNEHLTIDMLMAPKTCFKCKEKGHIATHCPNKNQQNVSGNKARNNTPRFQGPANPGPPPMPPQQPFPSYQQFQSPYYYQPFHVGPPVYNYNSGAQQQGQGQGKKVKTCDKYNHEGSCFRGQTCYFAHICNRCGDPHAGINCDKIAGTSFRPPQSAPTSGPRPRF